MGLGALLGGPGVAISKQPSRSHLYTVGPKAGTIHLPGKCVYGQLSERSLLNAGLLESFASGDEA